MVSGNLSIMFGFKGPNLAMITACTTANHCIGESTRLIEYGDADVMVAGGSECIVSPVGDRRLLRRRARSAPATTIPPRRAARGTRDRDGFVLGEGAGVLVLEEVEHAKARGAKIYCRAGRLRDERRRTSHDGPVRGRRRRPAVHGQCPEGCAREPRGRRLHQRAWHLDAARGHRETIAVKRCFGDHAGKLAVSSTKSMTGHLLGAAGGVEAVFTVLAVQQQIAPPTINLHRSGSRLRPRLRAQPGARDADPGGACRTPSASAGPTARWPSSRSRPG